MRLRKFVAAAALGTTVLTAVPALVAPQEAAAGCWGDYWSDCTPDDPGPGDWGGGGGDDWGGGGGDGSGGGGGWVASISEGELGDFLAGTVVIVGRRQGVQFYPGDPEREPEFWGNGGGGGGGGGVSPGAVVWSAGQTWNERQNCYKNPANVPTKVSQSVSYQVSFKAGANITAKASEVLSATLGAEVNTSINRTYALEITLNPGQTWALNVEYQTVTYAVTTQSLGMYTTEYVNVTKPTDTVSFSSC